ncbi:MAG: succinate dehydrogenase [Gammaproteobacteria bacterium]|nr:MAG: succinate dehydrogenase [Gammaproteobacteria bacterium]
MLDTRLYLLQRISAMIMAPLVMLHLGVIIIVIQGGLDSAEILSRTQGSFFWGSIYSLFVVMVSIHAAIGLRVVMFEWLKIRDLTLNLISWLIFVILISTGFRAVFAVVG